MVGGFLLVALIYHCLGSVQKLLECECTGGSER